MDRKKIAKELLRGCPAEALEDHKTVAAAVKSGATWDELARMPELDNWPETYRWLRDELGKNPAAVALGSIRTEKKAAAAKRNGRSGGRPRLGWALIAQYSWRGVEVGETISKHASYELAEKACKRHAHADKIRIAEI